jgi:hypothetical protein
VVLPRAGFPRCAGFRRVAFWAVAFRRVAPRRVVALVIAKSFLLPVLEEKWTLAGLGSAFSGRRFDADVIAARVPVRHTRLDFSPSAR